MLVLQGLYSCFPSQSTLKQRQAAAHCKSRSPHFTSSGPEFGKLTGNDGQMGLAFSMDSVYMWDVLINSFGRYVSEGYLFHMQLILENASAKLRGDVK